MIIQLIIGSFYLLLPAAFANMAPVLAKNIPFLKKPVDFEAKFRRKRLFGKNKTWRGVIAGVILAIIVVLIQKWLFQYDLFRNISLIQYNNADIILLGLLFGLGAMMGDLAGSFAKRQIGIKPGERFIFWDQTDWVIGSLVFISFYLKINLLVWVTSILLFFVLHIIVKHIGFFLKLEEKKW